MRRAALAAGAAVLLLVACSDDQTGKDGSAATSTAPAATAVGSDQLPIVDQIDEAITALEAQLGGPQQYFAVNATAQLVNLFVALNDGAVVQPWVYVDGELASKFLSDVADILADPGLAMMF